MVINILSYSCIILGVIFWLWGTIPLLGHRSLLFKLHSLSVADTLGSMAIVFGLLLRISREWPLLLLALFGLMIWNTLLSYVLAYCSSKTDPHPIVVEDNY
jgi:multicomponent Na+:H+ antiporter subunit G